MSSVLSSEIASKLHLQVFDTIAEARLAELDLEKLLIYMIDTVGVEALPFLGDQFNVLGLRGWNSAKTEQDKRDLIKRAVDLHRYSGTPYGIRKALQLVGYADAEFEEGVSALYDGYFDHDGTITYGGGAWALFRILVDLGESKGINAIDTPELIGIINTYKNVRSRLVGLGYKVTVSDSVPMLDDLALTITLLNMDTVDPLSDESSLIVTNDLLTDNFNTTTDSGIDLSVKNSLGVEINHYNF